uniref:Uncharacterized protein n=1 Tax=Populus trichocarpa TaxID=3694 RepID=A0A2K2C6B7_POPTR
MPDLARPTSPLCQRHDQSRRAHLLPLNLFCVTALRRIFNWLLLLPSYLSRFSFCHLATLLYHGYCYRSIG